MDKLKLDLTCRNEHTHTHTHTQGTQFGTRKRQVVVEIVMSLPSFLFGSPVLHFPPFSSCAFKFKAIDGNSGSFGVCHSRLERKLSRQGRWDTSLRGTCTFTKWKRKFSPGLVTGSCITRLCEAYAWNQVWRSSLILGRLKGATSSAREKTGARNNVSHIIDDDEHIHNNNNRVDMCYYVQVASFCSSLLKSLLHSVFHLSIKYLSLCCICTTFSMRGWVILG